MKRIYLPLLAISFAIAIPVLVKAQKREKDNWQNLDLTTDSVFGISTEKAYRELLKGKKHVPVIVAVNDGGVEITHEDLKRVIWVNKKEIAGNKKDDDKNGYVDDIHGWNFIGGPNGSVNYETLELTRLLRKDRARFSNVTDSTVTPADKTAYENYKKENADFEKQYAEAKQNYEGITMFKNAVDSTVKKIGKENPSAEDFEAFTPSNEIEGRIKMVMGNVLKQYAFKDFYEAQLVEGVKYYDRQLNYNLNLNYDPRGIVGDNPNNDKERYYGNNDVTGPDASHGTHVAGIIAADRTNNLGIMGISDDAIIMSVRCTPNGDERDKDVANAIRYAVDNGAKVINMSFGKPYTSDKAIVNEAMKYAASKDVLIVHAAGNDNENIDSVDSYPNHKDLDKATIDSWITVGASGSKDDESLKANFSNYGKTQVDVFAPGVNIYSTFPNSTYKIESGTSMAAPVVAGLAALIRSYYPKLTAKQVKEIIVKSATKVNHNVNYSKGKGVDAEKTSVPFSELCISGGVVNAYNALKLAETYK